MAVVGRCQLVGLADNVICVGIVPSVKRLSTSDGADKGRTS